MTAEEIIRKTRVSPLDDNKAPYLWEDVELVDYLNDAINDIMRSTEILRDRTSNTSITQISLLANLGIYALSDTVISVRSAMTSTSTIPLTLKTESWMDAHLSEWRTNYTPTEDGLNYLVPLLEQGTSRYVQVSPKIYDGTGEVIGASNISFSAAPNTIAHTGGALTTHFATGDVITVTGTTLNNSNFTVVSVLAGSMVVSETPVAEANTSATLRRKDGTLTMTVIRYPVSQIILETIHTQSPEISSVWHSKLRDGIAMYAYEKDDADCYNQGKADRARARFMRTIEEIKRENIRKYHAAGAVEVHAGTI